MFLQITNGTRPMRRLRSEMDRLMTDLFGEASLVSPFGLIGGRSLPAVNVWEDGDNLFAETELPGMKMEDVEISVMGDELTIRGERKTEEGADSTFHRRERPTGAFSRVIRLPVEVDVNKVEAVLRDGVLTVTLPKAEAAKPRRIPVKWESR